MNRSKHWYEYLWIVTPVYLLLGFFNILFAWLGMIFFCVPLIIAIATGNKTYCNRYCDRGQFLTLLGGRLRLSRNRPTPNWMRSRWFRYGFLVFFLVMFLQMLWVTYLVGAAPRAWASPSSCSGPSGCPGIGPITARCWRRGWRSLPLAFTA